MSLALWFMQDVPETGSDSTTTVRVIAGVVALVLIVIILMRRKRKVSKEDWNE
jgi:LPXTG-motif cell wall-anchored protein